jgi:hypothetical protein
LNDRPKGKSVLLAGNVFGCVINSVGRAFERFASLFSCGACAFDTDADVVVLAEIHAAIQRETKDNDCDGERADNERENAVRVVACSGVAVVGSHDFAPV